MAAARARAMVSFLPRLGDGDASGQSTREPPLLCWTRRACYADGLAAVAVERFDDDVRARRSSPPHEVDAAVSAPGAPGARL